MSLPDMEKYEKERDREIPEEKLNISAGEIESTPGKSTDYRRGRG